MKKIVHLGLLAVLVALSAAQASAVAVQKDFKVAMVQAYPRCNPSCSTTPVSDWTVGGGTVLIQKQDNLYHYGYSMHFNGVRNESGFLCNAPEFLTLNFKVDATNASGTTRTTNSYSVYQYCDDGEVDITNFVGSVTIIDGFYEVYDVEVYDSDGDLLAVPGFRR